MERRPGPSSLALRPPHLALLPLDRLIAMAASDMGVATMPSFLAQQGNADVRWVPVTGTSFSCEIVAAWRPDSASPCLRLFLDFLARPGVMDRMRATWIQIPGAEAEARAKAGRLPRVPPPPATR